MKDSTGYIHDSVHGHIELTPLEMSVLDTLEFQRLRFIRQNSLLHYVFPGAFHTRFAHSLGACHLGGQISRQIIYWVNEPEIYYPMQVYRLACLLHDVGHGAFSHSLAGIMINGEGFLPSLNRVLESQDRWFSDGSKMSKIIQGIHSEYFNKLDKTIEHEALSAIIISKIFCSLDDSGNLKLGSGSDVSWKIWAQDISSLLLGSIPSSDYFVSESLELLSGVVSQLPRLDGAPLNNDLIGKSFGSVLSELVTGTVDADRMDYLLRDSVGCGVNYGLYDKEGIVSSMRLVVDEGNLRIALNAKRINTLDDFLWSRYQMFKQVYCHKTHCAYNLLLERAMGDLIDEGLLKRPESIDDFCQLTDDLIMSMVFTETQKNPARKNWMGAFAKRQLPQLKTVFEAPVQDGIWAKDPLEIYSQSQGEKYPGWNEDGRLIWTSLKAEVIKQSDQSLPLIYRYDKNEDKYFKENYVERSVFFNSRTQSNVGVEDLKVRLNLKLMFFFKWT